MVDENITEQPLKLVIIGGDVVLPEQVRLWMKTPFRSVRLLNAYGPTETTITASVYEVNALDSETRHRRVPIGKPLPNRVFYILDNKFRPVPIGVPGELFIGGEFLSDGYLQKPELTETAFIANPFNILHQPEIAMPRMYRTGDLARYLPDGNVEFLGRKDTQVAPPR